MTDVVRCGINSALKGMQTRGGVREGEGKDSMETMWSKKERLCASLVMVLPILNGLVPVLSIESSLKYLSSPTLRHVSSIITPKNEIVHVECDQRHIYLNY